MTFALFSEEGFCLLLFPLIFNALPCTYITFVVLDDRVCELFGFGFGCLDTRFCEINDDFVPGFNVEFNAGFCRTAVEIFVFKVEW